MLISEQGKFIFVHVHKTAGSSIEAVLKQRYPDARHWHGRHGHARDGIEEIGQDKWDEYFSFAFVRNPWERLVSWYTMIDAQKNKQPRHAQVAGTPFASPFWNHAVNDAQDFSSFLINCTDIIYEKGCFKSYAFNQLDYMTDAAGDVALDFVGRFENLSEDLAMVFDRLDITDGLPRTNVSRHGHYSRYYSPNTRKLIEQRFRNDIDYFGYRFAELRRMNPQRILNNLGLTRSA